MSNFIKYILFLLPIFVSTTNGVLFGKMFKSYDAAFCRRCAGESSIFSWQDQPKTLFEKFKYITQCFNLQIFENIEDYMHIPFEEVIENLENQIYDTGEYCIRNVNNFVEFLNKMKLFKILVNPATIFLFLTFLFYTRILIPLKIHLQEQFNLEEWTYDDDNCDSNSGEIEVGDNEQEK